VLIFHGSTTTTAGAVPLLRLMVRTSRKAPIAAPPSPPPPLADPGTVVASTPEYTDVTCNAGEDGMLALHESLMFSAR
jgi:hypothetical protein